ncbi:MAG: 50S ribosomal protein L5 [bacterium]
MIRLKDKYQKEAVPAMMEKFGYKNKMAVPRIDKVSINTSFGKQIAGKTGEEQKKTAEFFVQELSLICGQKAVKTLAKKSIASFKIRQGMPLGAKVTLRGRKMLDFLERLIHLTIPRSRDFRGISANSVDKGGNLTLAVKEYISFPEVLPEKAKNIFSLEVTVVTTAKNKEEGLELLKLLGFPIKIAD